MKQTNIKSMTTPHEQPEEERHPKHRCPKCNTPMSCPVCGFNEVHPQPSKEGWEIQLQRMITHAYTVEGVLQFVQSLLKEEQMRLAKYLVGWVEGYDVTDPKDVLETIIKRYNNEMRRLTHDTTQE